MLLSLDINSHHVGVAFGGADDGAPRATTWKLFGCHDDDALNRSCASLYSSISEFSKIVHPTHVAIEAPLQIEGRNPSTTLGLFSLSGVARGAAQNAGARVIMGHVSTWRKYFIGQGNLKKAEAKRAVLERCRLLGWTAANDDEGDAMGLWAYAMATNFPKWSPNSTPLFGRKVAA